jgi:hypothetical protein
MFQKDKGTNSEFIFIDYIKLELKKFNHVNINNELFNSLDIF